VPATFAVASNWVALRGVEFMIAAGVAHVIIGVVFAAVGWLLPDGTPEHDVRIRETRIQPKPGRREEKRWLILPLREVRHRRAEWDVRKMFEGCYRRLTA
jgi:hypothetical protein